MVRLPISPCSLAELEERFGSLSRKAAFRTPDELGRDPRTICVLEELR